MVSGVRVAQPALFGHRFDFVSEFLIEFGMFEEEVEDSGECGGGCVGTGNPNLRTEIASGLLTGVGCDR